MSRLPLVPFTPLPLIDALQVWGDATSQSQRLNLMYQITGDYRRLGLPVESLSLVSDGNNRQDNLWQGLCFEGFFGVSGQLDYWELNFALTGAWNLYHFTDYRQGMTPELRLNYLDVTLDTTDTALNLALSLDLANLDFPPDASLDLSLTAVVAEAGSNQLNDHLTDRLSYWALAHRMPEPDFHCRDSFVLRLPFQP
jgi:hypothetical protein